jgi:adenylate kinase family enzyme
MIPIEAVAARVRAAPPRCGATRLVCVDGPSGAGKTQLATALAAALGDPPVVPMDELYTGWDGLAAGVARLRAEVVAPLTAGRPAGYRRWDWARGCLGEHRDLGRPPLLVIEGVGAGTAPGMLIWLDAPEEVRYRRAMDRDGQTYAPHWARWAAQERAHFDADRTADRADVVLTTA